MTCQSRTDCARDHMESVCIWSDWTDNTCTLSTNSAGCFVFLVGISQSGPSRVAVRNRLAWRPPGTHSGLHGQSGAHTKSIFNCLSSLPRIFSSSHSIHRQSFSQLTHALSCNSLSLTFICCADVALTLLSIYHSFQFGHR